MKTENIPTQEENPKGLHQRYSIYKLVSKVIPAKYLADLTITIPERAIIIEEHVDPNAEYFVLRLDTGGSDINHVKACRIGIHAYADAIEAFIPELATDLRERYPLIP